MEYKGYLARVDYDSDDHCFHGLVVNIADTVHFEGSTVDELEQAFRDSVDEYGDFCHRRGEHPDMPDSGEFRLHLDPALQREAGLAAARAGESLNAFIANTLKRTVRSAQETGGD